jgi:integrase
MKTTLKLKLRSLRRIPGYGVLVMHVTRRRVTRAKTTPYVLSFGEWDENKQCIVFPEDISFGRKKELASIRGKLERDLLELHKTVKIIETRGDYSSQELLHCFRDRQQLFCAYVLKKAKNLRLSERFGTAHVYQYAAVNFLKFLGGKDIHIEKINAVLMENYERFLLLRNKSKNTVSCYMRSLRAAYNQSIREKVFVLRKTKENPFSGVFTGNAKTQKRAIDRKSISRLMGVRRPELSFSRDLFLFSFYTHGMSFSDMVALKRDNIKEGFIRYKRKKTGQLITIELEDCMKEIIKRYTSSSEFIFPLLKGKAPNGLKDSGDYLKWKKTATALAVYNKNLKKLAGLAGIDEHLTSYVSRHSWATIASQEGIPIATISRGMGHESEKTTRIYISQTDYSDVGRANRQILSHFVRKTPTTVAKLLSC